MDLYPHLDPFTGHHIGVAFVLAGEVLPQLKPWPIRIRNVLRSVVAPHLVFGAPVGWPHVEAFIVWHVRRVRVQTNGHTDEAARCTAFSVLLWLTCHLHFTPALLKFRGVQDHHLNSISYIDRRPVAPPH